MIVGQADIYMQRMKQPPPPVNKNELKVDERPKCKLRKELLEEHIGEHFCDLGSGNSFQIGSLTQGATENQMSLTALR